MTALRAALLINISALFYILVVSRHKHLRKTRLTKAVGWIYLVSFLALVSLSIYESWAPR